jgi:hypothetical protein
VVVDLDFFGGFVVSDDVAIDNLAINKKLK